MTVPTQQRRDQQVREVSAAPVDVAIHTHKLLRVAAGRIGRGDERRIVLEDEPESRRQADVFGRVSGDDGRLTPMKGIPT